MAERYLSRAKRKEKEYRFMTMDIETGTDQKYGSALLGEPVYISWCKNGEGFGLKSDDLTEWMLDEFLTRENSGTILYVHNGFGFDMKRINWGTIAEIGMEADFLTGNDGNIKSITVRSYNWNTGEVDCEWIIRDTLLLIPMTLDKLTKTFSPDCLKIKREKGFDEKPFDPDDKADQEYAIQDSVALYRAIEVVDNLLTKLFNVSIHDGATLPSIAFRAFRQMIPKGEKYPGISFGLAHAARESYHGGQTIAFRTGTTYDAISLDANSMYPYVMLNWMLPTGKPLHMRGMPNNADPDKTLCLAVVKIPDGVFPLLKTKDKNGVTGNYNGVVTGWYWLFELEKQRELGATFEVLESYSWREETDVVKRFIEICKNLRMSDYHGAIGAIAKLLGNSLYGKFAQAIAEFMMVLAAERPENAIPAYDPKAGFLDCVWFVPSGGSFNADMTHWASFVTAKSRVILTEGIEKVGFEHIIYCDTDSIFFERFLLSVSCSHCGGHGYDFVRYRNRSTNYQFSKKLLCPRCNGEGNEIRGIMGLEYGQFKIEKGSEEKGVPFRAVAPKAYIYVEDEKMTVKNKGIPTRAILEKTDMEMRVEFVQSNTLSQMLKKGKGYGRKSKRKLASEQSTTNGKIENGIWVPRNCENRTLSDIRGLETPSYLSISYDMMIKRFKEGG